MPVTPEYRIVVVGAGAVGKSALTIRFVNGNFIERYDPTIEDSYRKQVEMNGRACVLDIMDTAGQEEYCTLRDTYLKGGDGFVLAYSILSQNSFDQASKLRSNILRIHEEELVPIMLVGNKCDLESERTVPTEEGRQMAEKWGTGFVETSAKTGKNVDETFHQLVHLIDKWRERRPPADPPKRVRGGKSFFANCSML